MRPPTLRKLAASSLVWSALFWSACADDPPTDAADDSASEDDDGDDDDNADDDSDGAPDGGGRLDGGGRNDASSGRDARGGGGDPPDGDDDDGDDDDASGGGVCAFVPNDEGWVAASTNGAKVQGAVFTYASMGSTIMPLTNATTPFTNDGSGKLCVKGSAAKVVDEMFSVYYGAGMGFDVCANGSSDSPANQKYTIGECPRGKDLVGFRFKLSGATIPSELRVQFKEPMRDESSYVLAKSGVNTVMFKDGKVIYDMDAPPVNVSKIESVQFAVPTNADSATPFDFCLEDIVLITEGGDCKSGGSGNTGGRNDAGTADSGTTTDSGAGPRADAGSESDAGNSNAGGTGGSCTKGTPAWSTTGDFATRAFGKYVLRNNVWGRSANVQGIGSQTIWGNGPGCWGVDAQHRQVSGAAGAVKSYPNIMRGWGINSDPSPNSGFPIRVSEIRRGKIRWKMQVTAERTWALWDLYFHESANAPAKDARDNAAEASVNLMVQQYIVEDQDRWMIRDSESWNKVTIGSHRYRHRPTMPNSTNEAQRGDVSNRSWSRNQIKLYVDELNGNTLGRQDMTIDLKELIDWAIQEGSLKPTDYLVGIHAGYEVVAGGTYVTHDFWTSINDEPEGN